MNIFFPGQNQALRLADNFLIILNSYLYYVPRIASWSREIESSNMLNTPRRLALWLLGIDAITPQVW